MIKRQTDRRTILMAAGAAAFAMRAKAEAARPGEIVGAVGYEAGGDIPEGRLTIRLEDPVSGESPGAADAGLAVESDGKSPWIDFALPAGTGVSPAAEIVALLERADGWLIARGSAEADGSSPVHVVLYAVMH